MVIEQRTKNVFMVESINTRCLGKGLLRTGALLGLAFTLVVCTGFDDDRRYRVTGDTLPLPRIAVTRLQMANYSAAPPAPGDDLIYYAVVTRLRGVSRSIDKSGVETDVPSARAGAVELPEFTTALMEYNLTKGSRRRVGYAVFIWRAQELVMSRDGRFFFFWPVKFCRPDVGVLTRRNESGRFSYGAKLDFNTPSSIISMYWDDGARELVMRFTKGWKRESFGGPLPPDAAVVETRAPYGWHLFPTPPDYPIVAVSRNYHYVLGSRWRGIWVGRRRRGSSCVERMVEIRKTAGDDDVLPFVDPREDIGTEDVIPLNGERHCLISVPAKGDAGYGRYLYLAPLDRPGFRVDLGHPFYKVPAGWVVTTLQPPEGLGVVVGRFIPADSRGEEAVEFRLLDIETRELKPLFTVRGYNYMEETRLISWRRLGKFDTSKSDYLNRVDQPIGGLVELKPSPFLRD